MHKKMTPPDKPTFVKIDFSHGGLMDDLVEMASQYSYSHNVFGRADAKAYVSNLAGAPHGHMDGWYGETDDTMRLQTTVYLQRFCDDRPVPHVLWKLRHPLFGIEGADAGMSNLLRWVCTNTANICEGSHKFIFYLSEFETKAQKAAAMSGFKVEGIISNYYRMGESCTLMGLTIDGAG